jgi:hypothetical protein
LVSGDGSIDRLPERMKLTFHGIELGIVNWDAV